MRADQDTQQDTQPAQPAIRPWVATLLQEEGDTERVVRRAQELAREAFQVSNALTREIDGDFGNAEFRLQRLEPLLRVERELDALRLRVRGVGRTRAHDPQNLNRLLQSRLEEYRRQAEEVWGSASLPARRQRLERYLEARRRQLYLGDAERVRTVLSELLSQPQREAERFGQEPEQRSA